MLTGKYNAYKSNRGFTLIEALVSLLVFSIGLMGIAGLQMTSLRSSTSAHWHSQATWLAYEMSDRMRANQLGVDNGDYDLVDTASPPSDPGCMLTGCTPTQMSDLDKYDWSLSIDNLPNGVGTVVRNNNQFTITITWDEANGQTNFAMTVEI